MAEKKRGRRKVLVGVVVSNKMDKTVVVRVERRIMHPLYKKHIVRHKKFMAHDENNECQEGDVVKIMETRPLSKRKRWRVVEILQRAQVIEYVPGEAEEQTIEQMIEEERRARAEKMRREQEARRKEKEQEEEKIEEAENRESHDSKDDEARGG